MAYNVFECDSNGVITGISPNCEVIIGAPEKIFLTKEGFSFASEADAKNETKWNDAIEAEDILPLPLIEEFTDNSEDDTYYVSPITNIATFIREGKTDFTFMFKFDPCLYKRLRGLNGKRMRLMYADSGNNVIASSPDGVKFQGVVSATLRVQKWISSTGDNLSFIPVRFVVESSTERNDQIAAFNVSWNIKGLNGIQPASLTVVSASATSIVVDVAQSCDGVAIEGITTPAEFSLIKASDSSAQTITTVTESGTIPGRYTLAGTGLVTGSVNIAGVLSLAGSFYKGTAATVTIAEE